MYRDKHGSSNLVMNAVTRALIGNLSSGAMLVCISGEGEPLNAPSLCLDVLESISRGTAVEFISSGIVSWSRFDRFIEILDEKAALQDLIITLRISVDKWHFAKARDGLYRRIAERVLSSGRIRLRFRSVLSDYATVKKRLINEFSSCPGRIHWRWCSQIEASIASEEFVIPIDFKSLAYSGNSLVRAGGGDLINYLSGLEMRYGRRFTLGNLSSVSKLPGPDIVIKHDGVVSLYGLESVLRWRVDDVTLDLEMIQVTISNTPLIHLLYSMPLMDVIESVDSTERIWEILLQSNNPYWAVREIVSLFGDEIAELAADRRAFSGYEGRS